MVTKVYVIILNYNGTSDTIECLESVLKSGFKDFQIIVVDNSETDIPVQDLVRWANGDLILQKSLLPELVFPLEEKPVNYRFLPENELLKNEWHEKILFVKAKENKGFAAGNNIALKYILKFGLPHSYVWILNNDTVIKNDAISTVVREINKEQKDQVIFGTPLLEYFNPKVIQALGGIYNKKTGLTSHFGEGQLIENCNFDFGKGNSKIDYPIGASIVISKNFLEKLGLLCEDYFLYHEELDWVYRTKSLGGNIKILGCFGVYHKQGESTKSKINKSKPEFIDIVSLNSRILFAKRFNKKYFLLIQLIILTITVGKRILRGNFNAVPKIIRLTIKGGMAYNKDFVCVMGNKNTNYEN